MFFFFPGVYTIADAAGFVAQLFSDSRSNATVQRNALHVEFHVEETNTRRSVQTSNRSEYNYVCVRFELASVTLSDLSETTYATGPNE